MKTIHILWLLVVFFGCRSYKHDLVISTCKPVQHGGVFPNADKVQKAMQELVNHGVPGCAMAVYSSEGWWESAVGYAKIETGTTMQTCNLQYLQSVAKTYLAVAVLKLYEQGRIALDAPMTNWLPEKYSRYVSGAEKVSVRMLLNHTSGIPDYNFSPSYVTLLLQNPDHAFLPEDYLKYIEGKPSDFEPGSRYSYRNINYVILALITDALTGDHARFIRTAILEPLGLKNTFYRADSGYLNYPMLVNTYWDRYSNGIVENVSRLQRNNVANMIGDDGMVTTPADAVQFLKTLMEGKLLSAPVLEEMKTWVYDSKGDPRYGLGLGYSTINGYVSMGHTGGGIGAGCELRYFPEKDIYMFIAINLGTVTDSPLHIGASEARDKLYEALLE